MANSIWLAFADGQYLFHLKAKRIDEVEQKCEAGFGEIYARLVSGTIVYEDDDGKRQVHADGREARWKNTEVTETIRQALIGGGKCVVDDEEKEVSAFRVDQLMRNYLDGEPLINAWKLAAAIAVATMDGYEPPKAQAEADADPSPTQTNDTEASSE